MQLVQPLPFLLLGLCALLFVQLLLEGGAARAAQLARGLEREPLREVRQRDVEHIVRAQQLVYELVHARECVGAVHLPTAQLAVVVVQRLEVLVHLDGLAREAHVVRAERPHVLVVLVFDELDDDLLLRLDLKHLEGELDEGCGLADATIRATDRLDLHRFVDQ